VLTNWSARRRRSREEPVPPAEEVAPPPSPPPPDRRSVLLSLFDPAGHGLEIGASFNPLLPKREGYDVEVLDHASTQDLVRKYRDAGVDVSRIETVDHVCSGGSMLEAIGRKGCFDFIVASHVIEHAVDLLGFLRDCQELLTSEGTVVLAVPDKRYSFDVLRPLTSTGSVLQAHIEGRKRHSPGALFDEVAYNCLREGALAWPPGAAGPLAFAAPLQDAREIFEEASGNAVFHDIHAWQFTPSSFRLVANDLYETGYLALREHKVLEGSGEFFVTLSRSGSGPAFNRLQLAQAAIAESREIAVMPD
jgi:hypothetical protein